MVLHPNNNFDQASPQHSCMFSIRLKMIDPESHIAKGSTKSLR